MTTRHHPPGRALLAAAALAVAEPASAAGGPCGGCFAVVRGDGTVGRSFPPLVTVKKRGPGRYEVNFPNGAVDACALTVSLGNGGNFASPTGSATAGRPASSTVITVVDVATFDVRGKAADRGFHLVVTC